MAPAADTGSALRQASRRVARSVRSLIVRTGLDQPLSRLTVGRPADGFWARVAPGNLDYRPPARRRLRRDGIIFELDVSDYMQWCAYYGIAIEPRQTLYRLVRPGDVALDVGSNVGEVLLNFARLVGPSGLAIGFEINPATFVACQRNISLNDFRNVQLHAVGLGSAIGTVHLGRPNARNSGEDRIVTAGADTVPVPVVTLDAFVAEQKLPAVNVIKIDVEGFELQVLRGAEQTLTTRRPRLFVELDDANLRQQGDSAAALVAWLEQRKYQVSHARLGYAVRSSDQFAGQHFDIIGEPR